MTNKFIASSIVVCAVGLLGSNIYAAEQSDTVKNNIIRICLEGIDKKDRLSIDFYNYLKGKNISIDEYGGFSIMLKDYDNIYLYEINNGSIFYEDILFSHPKVKSLVNNLQKEYNTTNKTTLRNLAKRELLANPNSLEALVKESLSKGYADKKEIFKSVFNREPNLREEEWMSNINTLKIAAYSGEINKRFAGKDGYDSFIDLTTEQINKINSDDGCKILISKNGDEEEEMANAFYELDMSYSIAQTLQLYASHEIAFNNNYRVFNNIKNAILPIFNIDIFISLSESELEEIHSKSILESRFNESKALENVLKKLTDKGLIEKNEETESPIPPEEENKNNFVQENHPFVERYNYYKNDKSLKSIFDKLSQEIWKFFSGTTLYTSNGTQKIYFSYKGKEYDTQIGINEDILTSDMSNILLEQISKELGMKLINSSKKTMVFFDNSINIIPQLEFNNDKENLSKIKESYKKLGISIYTKNQSNNK